MDTRVYAGTVGWGVWGSDDLGETWHRAFRGVYAECRIWSMSSHPDEPDVVWAGSDRGILRQGGDGQAEVVPSPADDICIWAFAQSPRDAKVLIIGTHPGAVFRSDDGGANWRELPVQLVEECLIGRPRITRIRFDPIDEDTIWASAEIDAVHRSTDGGDTWERLENGFDFPDIHDIAIVNDNGARKCLAATARGLYKSTDEGASWHFQALDSPWQYTRGMKPRADLDGTVFLCNGDGPPGSQGTLWRSRDWGETWRTRTCRPRTRRHGWWRRTKRTPTCCSAAPTSVRCTAAKTAAKPGGNCRASSARSARCSGTRRRSQPPSDGCASGRVR